MSSSLLRAADKAMSESVASITAIDEKLLDLIAGADGCDQPRLTVTTSPDGSTTTYTADCG